MDFVISPVSRHFPYSKVSRNSQTTKSLEIMTFQGILSFLLFLDTFALTSEKMTVRGHKTNDLEYGKGGH